MLHNTAGERENEGAHPSGTSCGHILVVHPISHLMGIHYGQLSQVNSGYNLTLQSSYFAIISGITYIITYHVHVCMHVHLPYSVHTRTCVNFFLES